MGAQLLLVSQQKLLWTCWKPFLRDWRLRWFVRLAGQPACGPRGDRVNQQLFSEGHEGNLGPETFVAGGGSLARPLY